MDVTDRPPYGATVRLTGELDIATCEKLPPAVAELQARPLVTLDLRGLDFMDSTGIHCLIEVHNESAARGQRIEVIAGMKLRRVIDLTGIRSILHFVDAS